MRLVIVSFLTLALGAIGSGEGNLGGGTVGGGTVGNGAIDFPPATAAGIQWPSSGNIVFQVDADNPNGSNLPVDNGSQDQGAFTAAGTTDPGYTAAAAGVPSFWSYDGVDQEHTLAMSGSNVSDPDATIAILHRVMGTDVIQDGPTFQQVPYLRTVYSGGNVQYRWNNSGNFSTGEGTGQWHLLVFTYDGASDQLCEVSTGTCGAAGSYGTSVQLSGGTAIIGDVSGNFGEVDVHSITVWDTTVAGADIKTAINAAYPGLL